MPLSEKDFDRALILHFNNIGQYLEGNGITDEVQRLTLIRAAESWDKLSVDGTLDAELKSRLLARPNLWGNNKKEGVSEKKEKPKAISLNIPYWKQTDNYRDANRTCFSSAMAMIIEYLKPDALPNDDTYVKTVFNFGDTTDPNVQLKALNHHGIQGTYRQNMDFEDLDKELAQGFPVGVAILHRGPLNAPTGGHWITCVGRNEDGSKYQFNDPYGSVNDGYQGDVENGKKVWYDRAMLSKRWTAEGKNTGWGMICRKK
jgi:hypothetical protein